MTYVQKILTLFFLTTTLMACQAAEQPTAVPQESAAQTDSPGSLPGSDATQVLTPTFTQEDTAMTPATSPNGSAERMITLVKQHLAQRLSLTVDQIVLSDVKPVVWRDAGLGCAKPGVDYIQRETPGYTILLEAQGKSYRYHTDETKRFVPCNR
jgi:hypothetical protein